MCHVLVHVKHHDWPGQMCNILSCTSAVIAQFQASRAVMPVAVQGDTPLHAAAQFKASRAGMPVALQGDTPLHAAAQFKASRAGMPVALQGDTPLHAAAQHAGPLLLKMLLDNGCNPLAENLLVSHVALLESVLGSEPLPTFAKVCLRIRAIAKVCLGIQTIAKVLNSFICLGCRMNICKCGRCMAENITEGGQCNHGRSCMPRAMPHNLACPGLAQSGNISNSLGCDCPLQATSNLYFDTAG